MGSAELWQVYDQQGDAVEGYGETSDAFDLDHTLYMANAHVWLYRRGPSSRQLLLQIRAMHLPRKPGYLHSSASGHVNLGEQPLDAAIRETGEELGIELRPALATLLFMQNGGPRGESFNYVYAYDGSSFSDFNINHDEVESVSWINLSEFEAMTTKPESYKLIDLGEDYFDRLLSGIKAL